MSSEWGTLSLGELGRIVTGKTPPTARPDFFGGHIPFLTPTDMVDGQKTVQATRTLTDAGLATVKNCLVPRGVAVSCIGWQMGKSVLVLEPTVTNQQINTLIVDESRFNLSFVYYLLANMRDRIFELGATPTRTPIVNKSTFSRIAVQIPSLDEQKKIAAFGAMLDDRITLLRETNATLEAIAQALFKSWFVDFDPVRAKQEGRAPEGMDEATAALFPDEFEESALGLVPRGWRVGKLGDVARLQKGAINPLSQPSVLFEHYSLPAFDNGQAPIFEAGGEIKSNKTAVPPNAVLLSKLNPHIPRVWLPTSPGQRAVCSTEFLVFIPMGAASREFLFCIFSASQFLQSLCQLVTGTSNSHQRIKPDGVLSMTSVIPPANALEIFEGVAKPIFDRIGHNRHQAKTLATLRDTLLPRLISGQLRLPEAEAMLEAV